MATTALFLLLALPQTEDEIRGWLRDLGSDSFEAREAAERNLKQAGPGALPLVREAAASGDLEISVRARQIAAHLQWSAYFLPHESAELIAMARRASAGSPEDRAQAIGELFTRAAPAPLVLKFVDDPDAMVRNAARWSALRCPDRAVAPVVMELLRENAYNRGSLATLVSDPGFFRMLDASFADELRRIAESAPADVAFVAHLALARAEGRGLPPEVVARLADADVWYPTQVIEYLRRHGTPDDVAHIEPLLDRGDIESYHVHNAISDLGGPHARRIYTARLQKLIDSGAADDESLMVEAGHVEATEAMPLVVRLLEAGVSTSSAGHALSDMEWTDGADAMLDAVRGGNSSMTNHMVHVGGPKIAAAAYAAWRKQSAGGDLDMFDGYMVGVRSSLHLADRAPEAVRLLADAGAPADLRETSLAELAGRPLPPDSEQAFRDALDGILSAPGPLTAAAADAAAWLGMRYKPEWKTVLRDAGTPAGLRRAGDLHCADAADFAREALASASADRREAALYYLGRAGTTEALRAALREHAAGHPVAALDAAAASGDAEAIRLACEAPLPETAIETLARLPGDAAAAALRRFVESGPAGPRLRATMALHRRDPASVPEPARTLVALSEPWDAYYADDARWKTPRADVMAALHRVFDPDVAGIVTQSLDTLEPATIDLIRRQEVLAALRSLGRLHDAESKRLLTRYLREGDAEFSSTAGHALVDLLGADAALPTLREAAAAAVDDGPILHAMARAGDADALRTLVSRLKTQDNHYVTGQSELRALDAAVNADAYDTARVRHPYAMEHVQWGQLLRQIELDHGVRFEISPGLTALKTVYDTVSLSGAYDLLSVLAVKPDKWDAFVVHVHKGDHVWLCTPVEAKAYWEKRVRQ